jgi:WD40 repeat protein
MSNRGLWNRRRAGRFTACGGWLLLLAGLGAIIRTVPEQGDELETQSDEKDRPFAQAARDDFRSPVWSLAFSPDDARLASATISGDVWLNDSRGAKWNLIHRESVGSARSLAFSPDGRALAVGGIGTAVRLIEVSTGEEYDLVPSNGENNATRVAFSPDCKYLAAGGFAGTVTLWEWATRRRLAVVGGHQGGITDLKFSPDGSSVAVADSAGMVTLWDLESGAKRTAFQAHAPGNGVTAMAFSPDGTLLATASYPEFAVRLWNLASGRLQLELPRTTSGARALAISPDGKLLAMARDDGIAVLWGIADARDVCSVRANEKSLQSVAFSGDGRMLATGGSDGCTRVWDVAQALSHL